MRAIAILAAITVLVAPALLGVAGWLRPRRDVAARADAFPWRLCMASALTLVLAFNLQFFVQELFLVLPKAFLPGVEPTLFHNNHGWAGQHPMTELFQGTGALATLVVGAICAAIVGVTRRTTTRLLLLWLAYCGVVMALMQVTIGAINPQSDVGRAMAYLQAPEAARMAAAMAALILMPAFALWLLRSFLTIAGVAGPGGYRARRVFAAATLPALIALPLIVPFRVPREISEVAVVPALVMLCGIPWMQAGAPYVPPAPTQPPAPVDSWAPAWLLGATIALLAIFQFVLRPGITF